MDIVLWIVQIVAGIAFVGAGTMHAFNYEQFASQPRTAWARDIGATNMRIIGLLEMLGGIGLVVPAATGILPWLTPIAAGALVVLMLVAAIFHLRRSGEGPNTVFNVFLGAIALVVLVGRSNLLPV